MNWTELHSCISCNKKQILYSLNWLLVYSLPTVMSFVTGNHTMFFPLKENLKNLFDSLSTGSSFENLSYLSKVFPCLKDGDLCSNILPGIESDLAYTEVSGVVCQYILQSGSLWHPLSSSMLKIAKCFISNFKINVCFFSMTVLLGEANNHIV